MNDGTMNSFDAELSLLTAAEGGRHTPVKSGAFRTDVQFKNEVRFCSVFFEEEFMHPGDTRQVRIDVLLHGESEIEYLLGLDKWLLFDGETKIAELKNPVLKNE